MTLSPTPVGLTAEELVEAYARVIDPVAFDGRGTKGWQETYGESRRETALTKARACIALGVSPGLGQPSVDLTSRGSDASPPSRVRYALSKGQTMDEMRDYIRSHPLYEMGDAMLVWANEGDLYTDAAIEVKAAAARPAQPEGDKSRAALNTPDPRVGELIEAAKAARDLMNCIEQDSPDNCWWVNVDDPEAAVCDTYEAVNTALAAFGDGR